jgi:hypothetical protein
MKVLGYTITPDIEIAVIERMKRRTFSASEIEGEFHRRIPADARPSTGHPCDSNNRGNICMRAADRLIQRHRKIGYITIVTRNPVSIWKWTAN